MKTLQLTGLAKYINDLIDDDIKKDKRTKNPLNCKKCNTGRYTNVDILGDGSKEIFCNKCGHVKQALQPHDKVKIN